MTSPEITLQFSPEALQFMARLERFPEIRQQAIEAGMNEAAPAVVSAIQNERLTGQGPFAVEEHRLGQRSGDLRQSVYNTPAATEGASTFVRIGSPIRYAAVHEFGFNGQVWVEGFTRHAKSRDTFTTEARTSKKTGRSYKAKVKTSSGVSYVQAHRRWLSLPARAPFGFGIADHLSMFSRAIDRHMVAALAGAEGGAA